MRQKNKLFKRKCLQAAHTEPSLVIRENNFLVLTYLPLTKIKIFSKDLYAVTWPTKRLKVTALVSSKLV